ncbi:UNVERIFIED_CONTAM: hypothetical protein FKN15_025345 [Acipenser sinensis]
MDQSTVYPVKLYVYDMSKGMARQLSPIMLGKQLDGIWHTAIVVHGDEFFYGGEGISSCQPGGTVLGAPNTVVDLGTTEVTEEIFMDYLTSLGESTYRAVRTGFASDPGLDSHPASRRKPLQWALRPEIEEPDPPAYKITGIEIYAF